MTINNRTRVRLLIVMPEDQEEFEKPSKVWGGTLGGVGGRVEEGIFRIIH